jgi:DNA-binding transcriptional MerR regulator
MTYRHENDLKRHGNAMYTPAQVSTMLSIATSTLRKYSAAYKSYLSPSANRKQRTYTDADIATLKRVCDLRSQNVPLAEISSHLNILEDTPPDTMTMIPAVAAQFEDLYKRIAALAEAQATEIDTLRTRIEQLENQSFLERLFPRKRK